MGGGQVFWEDRTISAITTISVVLLAAIAQSSALLSLSVDGLIAVASMSLLTGSRNGRRSGLLPRGLLALGSAASLAANVPVAEPSVIGRLIAAWPSCTLIGAYELLMRQIRYTAVKVLERDSQAL
ncbi:DUF2637 domain-containing protein [Actinomadura sp. 3N508]|uniref:DUF2637 domain-containing protein n=1 Tax=Actinomadura sp. 3N508 TaxID=3375153 RepID=UPI0037ACB61A